MKELTAKEIRLAEVKNPGTYTKADHSKAAELSAYDAVMWNIVVTHAEKYSYKEIEEISRRFNMKEMFRLVQEKEELENEIKHFLPELPYPWEILRVRTEDGNLVFTVGYDHIDMTDIYVSKTGLISSCPITCESEDVLEIISIFADRSKEDYADAFIWLDQKDSDGYYIYAALFDISLSEGVEPGRVFLFTEDDDELEAGDITLSYALANGKEVAWDSIDWYKYDDDIVTMMEK